MLQIVLNLDRLSDTELIQKVRTTAQGLIDHATDFTGIDPSAVDLTAAALTFEGVMTANNTLQQEALNSTTMKDAARAILAGTITAAGSWTQTNVTDETQAGNVWTLKRAATATTSMDQVTNLAPSFGDEPGEAHLAWNPVTKAKAYEIQCKAPGGEWTHAKTIGKSSVDIKNLTRGTLYMFRVRAIGPNELEGPWSDIAEQMAA